VILRELWRKSCGCWRYLQLADPAKIGGETTNLQSLTKKVARICTHSGKAVNFVRIIDGGGGGVALDKNEFLAEKAMVGLY
jgi:hypothetical protein